MNGAVDHSRICPVCGTIHWPPDLNNYAFRRVVRRKIRRKHYISVDGVVFGNGKRSELQRSHRHGRKLSRQVRNIALIAKDRKSVV